MRFDKILFLTFLLVSIVIAKERFTIDDYAKMDAEQKRKIFASNDKEINDPTKFLDLFILGLNDPDPIVQHNATARLSATMVGLQNYKREKGTIPVDASRMGEVQDALITKISSPDAQIRGAAFQALAFSAEPNPKIESALLEQLAQEQNDQLKGCIIETMGFAGYDSEKYIQTLRGSLSTPSSYDYVSDAAAKTIVALKPPGMLPLLAQMLEKKRSLHWGTLAMAAYGAEAKPYLPLLEQLAADPTLGMHGEISNVIAAIQNPPPSPTATPRIKAVSLQSSATKPPTSATAQTTPAPAQQPEPTESPTPTVATEKQPFSNFPVVLMVTLAAVIAGGIVFFLRRKWPK